MITQVTSDNKIRYQKLWEDAVNDLKTHDDNGKLVTTTGGRPIIDPTNPDNKDYAEVVVTADDYTPGEYYYISGNDPATGAPIYTKDADDATFDESKKYFLQFDKTLINSLNEYFSYIVELVKINPLKYTRLPLDENLFEIDANTRSIKVPDVFTKNGISVKGDVVAEIVYFRINRYFDMDDLATKQVFIEWTNAAGRTGVSRVWQGVDTESDPGYLIFGWPVDSAVTAGSGKVTFSVRFYTTGDNNVLTYSWSTLPQTAEIKNGLDFDISAMISQNNAEVIRDNDTMIIDRLIPSKVSDSGAAALEPVFFDYIEGEDGKSAHYGDLAPTFDMVTGGTNEDNTLYAAAYSPDGGSISYRWVKIGYYPSNYVEYQVTAETYEAGAFYTKVGENEYELATGDFVESATYYAPQYSTGSFKDEEGNDQVNRWVMVPTKERNKDASDSSEKRTYYVKTSKDGDIPTYSIFTGLIGEEGKVVSGSGDTDPYEGEIVYEPVTSAVVNGIGRYKAVAVNRANRTTAQKVSTVCIVAPPDKPTITTQPITKNILAAPDYKVTLTSGYAPDARKPVVSHQWYLKKPGETEFSEIESATRATLTITGADYNHDVDEGLGAGDGFYKVKITNTLNKEIAETESDVAIITHEASTPVIENLDDITGTTPIIEMNVADLGADGITLTLKDIPVQEKVMKAAIGSDENTITYTWYRVRWGSKTDAEKEKAQEDAKAGIYVLTDEDKLLSGTLVNNTGKVDENNAIKYLPNILPEAGSFYYICMITNSYNGSTSTISSPIYELTGAGA